MCANWIKPPPNKLSTEVIKQLIKDSYKLGIRYLNLTGGEIFLRNDILDIVSVAGSCRGLRLNIMTNGTLLTPKLLRRLSKAGLDSINIPIDSLDPEKNDRIRGLPGAFKKILEAIGWAVDLGLSVTVISMVSRQNFTELPEILRFAGELGVESTTFLPFMFYGDYTRVHELWISDKHELKILESKLRKVILVSKKCGFRTNVAELGNMTSYFRGGFDKRTKTIRRPNFVKSGVCAGAFKQITIDPEGNVATCPKITIPFAKITKNVQLKDILGSAPLLETRKRIIKLNCTGCWLRRPPKGNIC
jgi:radical SAM protein with 4Fe4S-binding SPASM domain